MPDLFEESTSLASQIARQVATEINRGRWSVGAALPSIRELTKTYGTSFSTVQAALRQLEMSGMVETRPRRGSIVKRRDIEPVRSNSSPSHIIIAGVPALAGGADSVFEQSWAARIGHAAERACFDAGYNVTKIPFDMDEEDAIEQVMRRVDQLGAMRAGMLMHGQSSNVKRIAAELDQRDVPWVAVNRPGADVFHNFVSDDNIIACQRVGRYFAQLGLGKVLVLSTDVAKVYSWMERVTGLVQGYMQVSRTLDGLYYKQCDAVSEESAYDATRRFIHEQGPPDGIFGTGDDIAYGGLQACLDAGLRIPQDVSVVGAAGLERYRRAHPSLAVLSQPMEEIGYQAATMLLTMVDQGVQRMSGKMIPCRFVARQSLAVPEHLRDQVDEIELRPDRNGGATVAASP